MHTVGRGIVFCSHGLTCIMQGLPGGILSCHQRKLHYSLITSPLRCTSFNLLLAVFFSLHTNTVNIQIDMLQSQQVE